MADDGINSMISDYWGGDSLHLEQQVDGKKHKQGKEVGKDVQEFYGCVGGGVFYHVGDSIGCWVICGLGTPQWGGCH